MAAKKGAKKAKKSAGKKTKTTKKAAKTAKKPAKTAKRKPAKKPAKRAAAKKPVKKTPALIAALSMLATVTATSDDVLPQSRAEALAMEAEDALPLTSFYDPPDPLGARAPGALIRSEAFQGYNLPPGAHAVRIPGRLMRKRPDQCVTSSRMRTW